MLKSGVAYRIYHVFGKTPVNTSFVNTRLNSTIANTSLPVIRIPNADVYRFGDGNNSQPVFKDLNWTVNEDESWAIVGAAGQEKGELIEVRMLSYMSAVPYIISTKSHLERVVPPIDIIRIQTYYPSSNKRCLSLSVRFRELSDEIETS